MYKTLLLTTCLALPLAAHAAEGKTPTPQQERMAACSKEAAAKKLKRDERNTFMSTCPSARPAAAEQPAR